MQNYTATAQELIERAGGIDKITGPDVAATIHQNVTGITEHDKGIFGDGDVTRTNGMLLEIDTETERSSGEWKWTTFDVEDSLRGRDSVDSGYARIGNARDIAGLFQQIEQWAASDTAIGLDPVRPETKAPEAMSCRDSVVAQFRQSRNAAPAAQAPQPAEQHTRDAGNALE